MALLDERYEEAVALYGSGVSCYGAWGNQRGNRVFQQCTALIRTRAGHARPGHNHRGNGLALYVPRRQ